MGKAPATNSVLGSGENGLNSANPYSAWIQAGSNVLASALSPTPTAATSSSYQSAPFDSSGWTVATGQGVATATSPIKWYVWVIAGLAAIVWVKHKNE